MENSPNNSQNSFQMHFGGKTKRSGGGWFFGVFFIVVGAGLLLDAFDVLDFGDALHMWWPSILMAVAIGKLASGSGSLMGSGILFAVGAILQLHKLDYIPGGFWSTFWPIVLILIGISILTKRNKKKAFVDPMNLGTINVEGSRVDRTAFFGGADCQVVSSDFTGGNLTAVFGGIDVDLRSAQIKDNTAILNVTAVFGGVEIRVPDEWNVVVRGTPIFGGIDESGRRAVNLSQSGPTLIIDCTVVFGGVEIC